ncbi:MAG: sugar transferase [Flavobacterium sp.]|nr:sugar transferase [Flavobacterium sp.]
MYKNYLKRIFDFVFSLIGFLILVPVFILVTILLSISNDGKPFFFQMRPGLNGKIFKIIKFKTMNDKKDSLGKFLSDEIRLTRVGAMVRKTSLDEIPQLINVIIGDMSLIGPRPLMPNYMHFYNEFEMQRQSVRPGITGLTAVRGRNNIPWNDKMKFDVEYAKNISFALDIEIFFKTILKIIISDGVNKDGFSSTDSFEEFCIHNPIRNYKL